MACFQVHNKLLVVSLPPVLLLLMIMCSLLSSSSCSDDDEDGRRETATRNITFDTMLEVGYLFVVLPNNSSGSNSSAFLVNDVNNTISPAFINSSYNGSFILPSFFQLWKRREDGRNLEASFTVSFSMSISQSQLNKSANLTFAILPRYYTIRPPPAGLLTPYNSSSRAIGDSYISININVVDRLMSSFNSTLFAYQNSIWIEISIQPTQNPIATTTSNYTVWIAYDRDWQKLSVYASEGKPAAMPDSPVVKASYAISSNMMNTWFRSYFAFFSSMEQLSQLHTWNSTFDVLNNVESSRGKMSTVSIVFVALGSSVAVAVLVATTVYCYFNSAYRRWKKDFDQLAKSMQRLPGVPIQVNFSDIQKATNNFHETLKLGQGGFGAVYRCMLPASVKAGGGEALDVAVKKFTRDDNRRYEDFLAEVGVINRLRHKNIVPLIGWSYNKGEPLLIYDYMPNGSLDQHLYRRSGDKQQRSPICQWDTRYNIVKDVATGLQYAHHEYEPVVLHRDIKSSNILIDSAFHGRLGDFGLACTVDMGKNSYTERGGRPLGTCGFVADEYQHSGRATRETDIFAFGVLILETVTGKPPLGNSAPFDHITDWVWSLHREGKLLDAVDPVLTTDQQFDGSDARRLLLLALACSSPNPSERPSMMEALQVITKLAPPPKVPLKKPRFVGPPEGSSPISSDYIGSANNNLERNRTTAVEMVTRRQISLENAGNSMHHRPIGQSQEQENSSVYHTAQI